LPRPFWKLLISRNPREWLNLGHISIDETKIKANASNNYTITEKELKLIKNLIMKGINVDIENSLNSIYVVIWEKKGKL